MKALDKVVSAPFTALAGAGPFTATVTLTVSESGILRFADAVAEFVDTTGTAGLPQAATDSLIVTDWLLNDATFILKGTGRNLTGAALSSKRRGVHLAELPALRVKSGDSVSLNVQLPAGWTSGADVVGSLSIPLEADSLCKRPELTMPETREVWIAAPQVTVPAGGSVTSTLVVDAEGLINLTRAELYAVPNGGGALPAPFVASDREELYRAIFADFLSVRTEYNMLVGQNGPDACIGALWNPYRIRNMVNFGVFEVSPSNPVALVLNNVSPTLAIDLVWAAPFYSTGASANLPDAC